jgi:hypothetical protein
MEHNQCQAQPKVRRRPRATTTHQDQPWPMVPQQRPHQEQSCVSVRKRQRHHGLLVGARTQPRHQHQHSLGFWIPLLDPNGSPPLVVWWRLALAPPRLHLSFIWLGLFVLESSRMPHLGMATLVGPPQLCGMVDAHMELVSAQCALRHASTASAAVFPTVLGCAERWRSRACSA